MCRSLDIVTMVAESLSTLSEKSGEIQSVSPDCFSPWAWVILPCFRIPSDFLLTLDILDNTLEQLQIAVLLSEDVNYLISGLDQSWEVCLSQNVSTHSFFFSPCFHFEDWFSQNH